MTFRPSRLASIVDSFKWYVIQSFYATMLYFGLSVVYVSLGEVVLMSHWVTFVVWTFGIHNGLYYLIHSFFFYLKRNGRFERFAIKRKEVQIPSEDLILFSWNEHVRSMVSEFLLLIFVYPVMYMSGNCFDVETMPSLMNVFGEMMVNIMAIDFMFYWIHRFLHGSLLYKRVHKMHHEYKGTVSIAAEHAHWLEDLISSQIPTILPTILMKSHICVWFSWLAFRLWQSYESHSGYLLLLSPLTEYHDYHHTVNIGNYGESPLWDTLFNTNTTWKKSKSSCTQN